MIRYFFYCLGVWMLSTALAYAMSNISGVFALLPAGKAIPESLLRHPDVTGLVIREKWRHLEAREGQYDFRYLDEQMAQAQRFGKKISLNLNYGGLSLPDWVFGKDIQFFPFTNANRFSTRYGQNLRIPVFWDSKALDYKKRLIARLGQRYSNHPGLVLVSAQCGNALTGDWNIPKSRADIARWRVIGYRSERLIQACKDIIDATMQAFPGQYIKMAIGPVPGALGDRADYVARAIIDYANRHYPGRFIAQRNNLSAKTPDPRIMNVSGVWRLLLDNTPNSAAQMLWFSDDPKRCRMNGRVKPCDAVTVLQTAIAIGLAYRLRYFEIYARDIRAPFAQPILHELAQKLN